MFDGKAFHSLVVVGKKNCFRMCWTSVSFEETGCYVYESNGYCALYIDIVEWL